MWWLPEGKGVGEVDVGEGERNGNGKRFGLDGEHTTQYTGDISYNCTSEIYMILLTNVTPINSIRIQKLYRFQVHNSINTSSIYNIVCSPPQVKSPNSLRNNFWHWTLACSHPRGSITCFPNDIIGIYPAKVFF